jgi:hypothetical protein
MDGQKGYLNFIDMINGGGMGAAGDKFEGGGLLSMLGNALGIAPYGAARERDLEMAANAAAGVAIKPDIVKPIVDAESKLYSGRGSYGMPEDPRAVASDAMKTLQPGMGAITQTTLPPTPQPSYDPRGPMYGDQNAVSDQELMQFAQTMHPDNRYFFLNSDRGTQVRSYLQAMGY